MTYDVLARLLEKIKFLRDLNTMRADERLVRAAVLEATLAIDELAADEMASDYASEIRIALRNLPDEATGLRLSQTAVGERIEHLVAYGLVLSVASMSGGAVARSRRHSAGAWNRR
jgi:hypothetical protein